MKQFFVYIFIFLFQATVADAAADAHIGLADDSTRMTRIGRICADNGDGFTLNEDGVSLDNFDDGVSPMEVDRKAWKAFKKDPQYDYYSYRTKDGRSLWSRLLEAFFRWLSELLRFDIKPEVADGMGSDYAILGLGIALVVGLLILIYSQRKFLFFRNTKRKQEYTVGDETIYGIDFNKFIDDALRNHRYTDAIRWKYLQLLKLLQDKELINWKPNKTVIEYVHELKNPEISNLYRSLAIHFLYFRYGNFEATENHFREVERLSNEIKKMLDA